MKIVGLVRTSGNSREHLSQRNLILEFARQRKYFVEEFIEWDAFRKISAKDELFSLIISKLSKNDILLVSEFSHFGKNMLQALNLIIKLLDSEVNVIFVSQPELSSIISEKSYLRKIYKYFADAELEFVSIRTRQGLAAAQAKGRLLGRPKGSKNKKGSVLDQYHDNIKYYLEIQIPIQSILKLINRKLEEPISYNALKYYIERNPDLKILRKNFEENINTLVLQK